MGPMNVARGVRCLQRHCPGTETDIRQSQPGSVRSDRTTKDETPVGWYAMLRPADVKCERSVAVAIASLLLRLPRHACADRPTSLSKHLTYFYDDDGKSTECCHGENYVRILRREQYSHVDSNRVVCLRT